MKNFKRVSFKKISPKRIISKNLSREIAPNVVSVNNRSGISYSDKDKDSYLDNPDVLVKRKGLRVYDYMLNDDQVYATSQLKKIARLATEFNIYSASDSKKDQKVAEFVRWALCDGMEISLRLMIYNILTAMDYGYSICEKVFRYVEEGEWKGKIAFKNIMPKSPFGYFFDQDKFGNLKGVILNTSAYDLGDWMDVRKTENNTRFPVEKFVLFSHNGRFNNPYGTSDLRAGYRSWISKDIMMKYWSMYLEKYGAPIPMAEIPAGTDPEAVNEMKAVLEDIQMRSALTYPTGFNVKYLESERTASPAFEKAITMHNGAMSRSSIVPDLMGVSGGDGGGGSYGLGRTQYDVFVMVEEYIGLLIEETVFHKQIIKPLVDMNFSGIHHYPFFKFSSIKRETRKDRAQILQILVSMGIIEEVQPWMFGFVDLPIPKDQIPESGKKISIPGKDSDKTPGEKKTISDWDRGNKRSRGDEQPRSIGDETNPNIVKDDSSV